MVPDRRFLIQIYKRHTESDVSEPRNQSKVKREE